MIIFMITFKQINIYIYIYICICMCVFTYIYIYICICVYVYMYMYIHCREDGAEDLAVDDVEEVRAFREAVGAARYVEAHRHRGPTEGPHPQ